MRVHLLLSCIILILSFTSLPADQLTWKDASGKWTGKVRQYNPDDEFQANLTLDVPGSGGIIGHVALPNFECTADLYLGHLGSTTLQARVQTKENPVGECPEGGSVVLEIKGNELLFLWDNKEEKTGIAGTLTKLQQ